jgi:hypothetical protein
MGGPAPFGAWPGGHPEVVHPCPGSDNLDQVKMFVGWDIGTWSICSTDAAIWTRSRFRRSLASQVQAVPGVGSGSAGGGPIRESFRSSRTTSWIEPAIGIATSAPSTPISSPPIRTATSTRNAESCTVFR